MTADEAIDEAKRTWPMMRANHSSWEGWAWKGLGDMCVVGIRKIHLTEDGFKTTFETRGYGKTYEEAFEKAKS